MQVITEIGIDHIARSGDAIELLEVLMRSRTSADLWGICQGSMK